MIISKALWIVEGEKPSKWFCSLQTKHYIDKTIVYLEKQKQKNKQQTNKKQKQWGNNKRTNTYFKRNRTCLFLLVFQS